jgi:hypothetical protein
MRYNELCAISGLSGLYQLLSTKSDGAIVKSLEDDTTKFVAARSHNVTPLDSIEVYTETDNIRLFEVFQNFKANESKAKELDITKLDNKKIKETLGSDYTNVPVYLLHGDLTPAEMNGLYEHPKVKAMLNFTKGEGFGRPLLEFS